MQRRIGRSGLDQIEVAGHQTIEREQLIDLGRCQAGHGLAVDLVEQIREPVPTRLAILKELVQIHDPILTDQSTNNKLESNQS